MVFRLLLLLICGSAVAQPLRLMVIGDSQSEEYRFEIPFSAPVSNPTEANTQNWVEILAEARSEEITFGNYEPDFGALGIPRNAGFETNWGIPTAEMASWARILSASLLNDQQLLPIRLAVVAQLAEVDACAIILGGNDVNSLYRELYEETEPIDWIDLLIAQLTTITTTLDSVPLLIATPPDVGVTPFRSDRFTDPARRARATAEIQKASDAVRAFAVANGHAVIDLFGLTQDLSPTQPYLIGGLEFLPLGDPENSPRYLFCRDGFHPSTAAQLQIANLVIEALNQRLSLTFSSISESEQLTILDISPDADETYLAAVSALPENQRSFLADPDGDGLPNLGELALQRDPTRADPLTLTGLDLVLAPNPSLTDYVESYVEKSDDLRTWSRLGRGTFFRANFRLK